MIFIKSKRECFFAVLAVVLSLSVMEKAPAQVLESFELGDSCNYFGDEETPERVHTFASSKEAEDVIGQIMETVGLPQNFDILSAGVSNAAANISGEKRFILYSRYFMHSLKTQTNNEWAPISIMAHEIGHHLSGHTLGKSGSRPKTELEADRFSGSVLQKMGAGLGDALAAMEKLGNAQGSATHPAKRDRLEAITSGWEDSCTRDADCKTAGKTAPNEQPQETPKVQGGAITEKDFAQAWESDNSEVFKRLIAQGFDLNKKLKNGETVLLAAIQHDKIRITHALLDGGANPNLPGPDNITPLIRASFLGHLGAVKALLNNSAYPDAIDTNNFTALHYASGKGHKGIVKALLNARINPNIAGKGGITALMFAALEDRPDIVKELMAGGANLNLLDSNGKTARDHAKAFSDISGILRRAGGICNIRICL